MKCRVSAFASEIRCAFSSNWGSSDANGSSSTGGVDEEGVGLATGGGCIVDWNRAFTMGVNDTTRSNVLVQFDAK